jgi:hypothetical protein
MMKIIDSLGSLQDLQLLLTLMDDPERWWDARAIAEETGEPISSTGLGLDRLAAKNLLDIRVTEHVRFRYRPGTAELKKAGAAFVDADVLTLNSQLIYLLLGYGRRYAPGVQEPPVRSIRAHWQGAVQPAPPRITRATGARGANG